MPTPVIYKHFARVVVTKGAYVSDNATNVIGIGEFDISDIRNDGTNQSDVIGQSCYIEVIRPNLKFNPNELVVTVVSNSGLVEPGVRVKLDFKRA